MQDWKRNVNSFSSMEKMKMIHTDASFIVNLQQTGYMIQLANFTADLAIFILQSMDVVIKINILCCL